MSLIVACFGAGALIAAWERFLPGAAFSLVIALLPAYSLWSRGRLSSRVRVREDGAFVFVRNVRKDVVVLPREIVAISLGTFAVDVGARDARHIRVEHERGMERLPLTEASHRVVAALRLQHPAIRVDESYTSALAKSAERVQAAGFE